MQRIPTLWKANAIAFISSFCVMVLEIIAARMLAPYIGVSLYTWTSIIGVILGGIAIGNFLGGKLADRFASPTVLAIIFFAGSLATIAILPVIKAAATADWFNTITFWPANFSVMLNFIAKVLCIFFLPATILSMVSPMVIKLTLADLGQTGGVVGTIYAFSTTGAILGTFMTGFYFILWFGTRSIVWLVAAILVLTGVIAWFAWRVPDRWRRSPANLAVWITALVVVITSVVLYGAFGQAWSVILSQSHESWEITYSQESNYFTIDVLSGEGVKELRLDLLAHSYVVPNDPAAFMSDYYVHYNYLRIFSEIVEYLHLANGAPRVLHLGGGGYSFPRYMLYAYPASVNDVVEIDPAVTLAAHLELGLPWGEVIRTYTQDARFFLAQRKAGEGYNMVVGDVFNDLSTPYHLTTLEFDRLVKANMTEDGIYLLNIHDDYRVGRFLPSMVYTLQHAFKNVYLFGKPQDIMDEQKSTFAILATDRQLDLADYRGWVTGYAGQTPYIYPAGSPLSEGELAEYLEARKPLLLTDDYAPTDILVAPLIVQ